MDNFKSLDELLLDHTRLQSLRTNLYNEKLYIQSEYDRVRDELDDIEEEITRANFIKSISTIKSNCTLYIPSISTFYKVTTAHSRTSKHNLQATFYYSHSICVHKHIQINVEEPLQLSVHEDCGGFSIIYEITNGAFELTKFTPFQIVDLDWNFVSDNVFLLYNSLNKLKE